METDNAWLEVNVWALRLMNSPKPKTGVDDSWTWVKVEDIADNKDLMSWERELITQTKKLFADKLAKSVDNYMK